MEKKIEHVQLSDIRADNSWTKHSLILQRADIDIKSIFQNKRQTLILLKGTT